MGSKKKQSRGHQPSASGGSDKPATLKDLLGADTIAKLKQQAEAMKQEEAAKQEAKRAEAEAARRAEQKRNENDFAYLLEHSKVKGTKYI
ncbi:YqkE family protein [Cohnella sp. GCM10027633]|uniref:YqkE family protein n=1 Tax=unclassified Cohnella TaxID=2636738 RepID=UPI003637EFBC